MVSDVEPIAFPSRNVGGEFVGKVSITGLLSKLDAGAPTTDGFLEVGCGFTRKRKRKRSHGVQFQEKLHKNG
jgi:hypothetical protein